MKPSPQMSSLARERMADMLPGMLASVRSRRRRRQARNAGLLAAAALLLGLYAWSSGEQSADRRPVDAAASSGSSPMAASTSTFVCEVVRNLPDVRSRYAQEGAVPADWFVDDEGLQQFLRQGQRPEGIVRVAGKAMVAISALDPFPVEME